MTEELLFGLMLGGTALVIMAANIAFLKKAYHRVEQDQALIVHKHGRLDVSFQHAIVIPMIYRAEYMDISPRSIEIDRRGAEGLVCSDNIRVDVNMTFIVRVNRTAEAVRQVAESVGCALASDQATLELLFQAKLSDGMRAVASHLSFADLNTQRDVFCEEMVQSMTGELDGFLLERVTINLLKRTPIDRAAIRTS